MRENTCMFTGHRIIDKAHLHEVGERLMQQILQFYEMGVRDFITGGAQGFDTLAALQVLILRDADHKDIRLHLALPCRNQCRGWPAKNVRLYESILKRADSVHLLSQTYHRGCMHERNRFMVDHSAYCICYQTHAGGGTDYTVKYARDNQLKIVNVAPRSAL